MRQSTSRRDLLLSAASLTAAAMLPAWARGRQATTTAAPAATGRWSPVPLVSGETREDLRRRGLPDLGGEGGQWVRSVAFGPDGLTAIWGTDVGGLYRTLDGGRTWEPCNVGFVPRGTCTVAFDPRDASRIVVAAANSMATDLHGLYLSTDRGASWRHVLSAEYAGVHDWQPQVAFDPTGDRVYWSRVAQDKPNYGEPVNDPALYVSDDRGETWRRLDGSERLGGAILCHHPAEPTLFAAAPNGVYAIRDGGADVEKVSDLILTGLDCSAARPGRLLATTADKILASDDGGRTWNELPGTGDLARPEAKLMNLRVSPADGDRFGVYREAPDYDWTRHVTHDGGETFAESTFEGELNFLPRNGRHPRFAWHPTDANVVLASGGDWPCRSDDGGRTFRWSAGGVNNIYCGTSFGFCPSDPDVLFLSSQDYNGGVTRDGGRTWTYAPVSGEGWGGFTYGSASASASEHWCGLSRAGWGGPRTLMSSGDGGKTWSEHAAVVWSAAGGVETFGFDSCFCDPEDSAVRFAGPWCSGDGGKIWAKMDGCHGVWNAGGGMLFGGEWDADAKRGWCVATADAGRSWHRLAETGWTVDCAYDPSRDRLYVVANKTLLALENVSAALKERRTVTPRQIELPDPPSLWANEFQGVAVDPREPSTLYVARHSNVFSCPGAAMRSTDAGQTWQLLTRTVPLKEDRRDPANLDGGREAMRVRVHPTTGAAWFTTGCYGIWTWELQA